MTASRFTLHVGSQGVNGMRANIAEAMGVERKDVHILTGQVGGSFGMKAAVFPEYICALHAARALGRPVKWNDERSGSFVSDSHGRDHEVTGELALAADGTFLAIRITSFADMGAFLSPMGPLPGTLNTVKNVQSMYRTPLIEVSSKCVFTNTSQTGPYRGAGRPEGNYFMERLIDAAAAEMGIDRLALRRRNQIRPQELPYKTASDVTYDSGDFAALTKQALELADSKGFAAPQTRKPQARQAARPRHRQFSGSDGAAGQRTCRHHLQCRRHGHADDRNARFRHGPRHAVRAGAEPAARHSVRENFAACRATATASCMGGGSGGSKSLMHTGTAIVEASAKVIEKGKEHRQPCARGGRSPTSSSVAAASSLPAPTAPSRMWTLAQKLRDGSANLPPDAPQSLDVSHISDGPGAATFPNGCHIAEVEVDPDTGVVALVKYSCVNDFGNVVNPMIVAGQLHGGVVQGIGQALMEMTVYDGDGQLLTGSFSTTPCRARPTCPFSCSQIIRCRPRPIRSAPKAAAKPAAPVR